MLQGRASSAEPQAGSAPVLSKLLSSCDLFSQGLLSGPASIGPEELRFLPRTQHLARGYRVLVGGEGGQSAHIPTCFLVKTDFSFPHVFCFGDAVLEGKILIILFELRGDVACQGL